MVVHSGGNRNGARATGVRICRERYVLSTICYREFSLDRRNPWNPGLSCARDLSASKTCKIEPRVVDRSKINLKAFS